MRGVFEKHGTTPEELFAKVTPSQFLALFTKAPTGGFDRVEELTLHNDNRGRRGLRPVFPSWL